jgi:RND family efflux transporter MFP subunit
MIALCSKLLRNARAVLPIVAVPIALSVAGMPYAGAALADAAIKPVKLIAAGTTNNTLERTFFGQVAARRSVDLAFQVGGQIVEFPVLEGFTVPQGDMIAQLDLETFELSHEQAKLQLEQADRTQERLARLKGSAVSVVAVEDSQTNAALARIALRNTQWALDHATLRAPFDGLISSRNVELFTTINAGSPVVRIHDMSELRIEVDVPELLFQQAGANPNVEITAHFAGHPDPLPLTVREFDAETSAVGQTFRLTFAVSPPENHNILPGSSVTVHVRAQRPETVITLPPTAVVADSQGNAGVMLFVANTASGTADASIGRVQWTAVDIMPNQAGMIIVTDGLAVGSEVVATGGGALADGQAVRRYTGFSN